MLQQEEVLPGLPQGLPRPCRSRWARAHPGLFPRCYLAVLLCARSARLLFKIALWVVAGLATAVTSGLQSIHKHMRRESLFPAALLGCVLPNTSGALVSLVQSFRQQKGGWVEGKNAKPAPSRPSDSFSCLNSFLKILQRTGPITVDLIAWRDAER